MENYVINMQHSFLFQFPHFQNQIYYTFVVMQMHKAVKSRAISGINVSYQNQLISKSAKCKVRLLKTFNPHKNLI